MTACPAVASVPEDAKADGRRLAPHPLMVFDMPDRSPPDVHEFVRTLENGMFPISPPVPPAPPVPSIPDTTPAI